MADQPSKRIIQPEDLIGKAGYDVVVNDTENGFTTRQGSGGTGTLQEDILYAALVVKINAGTLVKGQQYKITDYTTKHYIVDADGNQYLDSIITGANEALIVTATSTNTIDKIAYSLLHPEDIIHYDWNPANWSDDQSFFDYDDEVIVPGFKGVIYFRHDTLLDNYTGYDFRNVKFRRWKTDCDLWDDETEYSIDVFVEHEGFIYKSSEVSNTGNIPADGSEFWIRLLDLSLTEYYNSKPSSAIGIPSGTDFDDFKTFNEGAGSATYALSCRGNHIEPFNDNNSIWVSNGTLLRNYVFFLQDINSFSVYSNTIGAAGFGITVGGKFYYNSLGINNYDMVFGDNNTEMIFGNDLFSWVVANNNTDNRFGCVVTNITLGDGNNDLSIENSCNNLKFGKSNLKIVIGNLTTGLRFTNNNSNLTFGNGCAGMQLRSNNSNITFGNGVQALVVNGSATKNAFADGVNFLAVDFSTATHIYGDYTCNFFARLDGTLKLSYFNNSDVQTIVNANA